MQTITITLKRQFFAEIVARKKQVRGGLKSIAGDMRCTSAEFLRLNTGIG